MSFRLIVLFVHSCVFTKIDFLNDGFSNWMYFLVSKSFLFAGEVLCSCSPADQATAHLSGHPASEASLLPHGHSRQGEDGQEQVDVKCYNCGLG